MSVANLTAIIRARPAWGLASSYQSGGDDDEGGVALLAHPSTHSAFFSVSIARHGRRHDSEPFSANQVGASAPDRVDRCRAAGDCRNLVFAFRTRHRSNRFRLPTVLREQVALDTAEYHEFAGQAAAARSRLTEAQQRLETFARERFDDLHRAADSKPAEVPTELPSVEPSTALSRSAEELEADRLRGRLTELDHERSRMLERLTDEHPLVRDVDSQIADVRRQLAALPLPPATVDPLQAERQSQARLRDQWQELVDEAAARSEQLDADRRAVEQELSVIEARRAKAEQRCLHSAQTLAASGDLHSASEPPALSLGVLLLACACGLPLVAVASRRVAQSLGERDSVIREPSEIERLFHLPVAGVIVAGDAGIAFATQPARRPLPLVLQVLAAVLVFLLVAMTVQDPHWLSGVGSHPIDAFRQALGNLGGR